MRDLSAVARRAKEEAHTSAYTSLPDLTDLSVSARVYRPMKKHPENPEAPEKDRYMTHTRLHKVILILLLSAAVANAAEFKVANLFQNQIYQPMKKEDYR